MQNYKLDSQLKNKVITMIATGYKNKEIVNVLKEDHDIDYTSSAIDNLKKTHETKITEIQEVVNANIAQKAERIQSRTLDMLSQKLDKAEVDSNEIEKLDRDWREGKLTDLDEYRRRKKGLIELNINTLLSISKSMSQNTIPAPENPTTSPAGATNPALAEALITAIKKGDTIALQQLVVNPNGNS